MSTPYQQAGAYMPKTDAGFRDWLSNFASLISSDPYRFGMTEADAQMIVTHNDAYEAAYVPVQSAETRTSAKIQHKDAVKASAMASCRVYAQIIKHNQGVSNEDKAALGINIDDVTPSPIPAPSTAPVLTLRAALSGEHIITFADQATPQSKAKPPGASQLELYLHVGAAATADPDQASFVAAYGRNPIRHTFEANEANQTATYFARWRTQRGLVGPWSAPIAMGIAFAGAVQEPSFVPDGGSTTTTTTTTPGTGSGDDDLKIAA